MNFKLPLLIFLLLLLVTFPAMTDEAEPVVHPWTPEPVVDEQTGYATVKVELPGALIAITKQVDPSGARHLLLLSEDLDKPEDTLSIFSLDPSGAIPLVEIRRNLPTDIRTLFALDLDGDGTPEPVVGRPGGLYALPLEDQPELLIETHRVVPRIAVHWSSGDGQTSTHHLTIAGVGTLQDYRFTPGKTEFTLTRNERLPITVGRGRDGLYLKTPLPVQLTTATSEPPLLAIGPVARGKQRLLTLLVDLSDQEDSATALERWSRLPQPEDVIQRWFRLIEGEPALVVTSLLSEQKGALEKKKLRVFMLGADRTRGGANPILEIKTPSRQWFDTSITISDINADGRDDIVVVAPEGLGGGKLLLEGYLGRGAGSFKSRPRRTMLDLSVKEWHFGGDVNGDGIGDLVVIEDGHITAYAGIADSGSNDLVDEEHLWRADGRVSATTVEVTVGAISGNITVSGGVEGLGERMQVLDLVGDARAEVLLASSSGANGRGSITLILPR
jgi:hypothetical protein